MTADRIALSGRIQTEMSDLARVVARCARIFRKAQESGDTDWLDGVALNLHAFYAGIESIFEELARDLDDALPSGPEWHRSLLMQMAADLPGIRPPIIGRTTRDCLDAYRGFRHVVRNVYTFNLRPARLRELVEELPACYAALAQDIAAISVFLEDRRPDDAPTPHT